MKRPDDFWLMVIGIPVVSLLIPPLFMGKAIENTPEFWIKVSFSFMHTLPLWFGNRYVFRLAKHRYGSFGQEKQHLLFVIIGCTAFTLAATNLICVAENQLIFRWLADDIKPEQPSLFQINMASFLPLAILAGIYESRRYAALWRKAMKEKEALERENLSSQLEGLRNQVNPHFLFNSLNTLVNLIPEHPDNAVRFVQKLSTVYRYILEIRNTETTALGTELEFLNAYIYLLKERFGDNIRVSIGNMDLYMDKQIVPLSLQILLENAIKHNIISSQKPLLIDVFIHQGSIIVRNNLQVKNQVQESTGVGLENIRNRYHLVAEKTIDVRQTATEFEVVLPLV